MWIRINADYNRFSGFIFQDKYNITSVRISLKTKSESVSVQDFFERCNLL